MKKPVIAITMGDPGGIGPEVIVKALKRRIDRRDSRFLLIGSRAVFEILKKTCPRKLPLFTIHSVEPECLKTGAVNFLDITAEASSLLRHLRVPQGARLTGDRPCFQKGKISVNNGALALAAVKVAAYLAREKKVHAVVTGPVSKKAVQYLMPCFRGHTEYLAEVAGAKKFAMMFVSRRLTVTLVTIHIPLAKVPCSLTRQLIREKIRLTHDFLVRCGKCRKPKIAVCALNPHGNELGREEDNIIRPAVLAEAKRKIQVSGPYPADRLFYDAYQGRFDALISMYHDQALGPFKMVSFHDGINVTLGLPYVRTSPDHGTAMDIAYQNKADPSSMLAALDRAREWVL